jgi:hypothetical protein
MAYWRCAVLRKIEKMLQHIAVMLFCLILAVLITMALWGDFQTGADFISACAWR